VDIICLANSRKHGGHCVAGLRLDGGGWLRPVGVAPDGVLWPADYTLATGEEARTLEVIRVGLRAPRPAIHQPENWVIDGTRWSAGACPANRMQSLLRQAIVPGPELLTGTGERVAFATFEKRPAPASLALVAPEDIYLYPRLAAPGTYRARGRFSLGPAEQLVL
jgi:hypothetical protein